MSPADYLALAGVLVTVLLAIIGATWSLGHRLGRQDSEMASIKEELRWQSSAILRLFRGRRDSDPPERPRGKLLTLDDPLDTEKHR